MNLCDIINDFENIKLYRNGEFIYLDFMNSEINEKVLTFIEDQKYINNLSSSISCVICSEEIAKLCPDKYGVIVSEKPRLSFYLLHNYLSINSKEYQNNSFETIIGEGCKISKKAIVENENVIIGNNTIIEDNVVIRGNVCIGENCIIRAGSIIGGDGFQFIKEKETYFIQHCGGVIINDKVEVQYNCCIDKALFPWDNTKIGYGSKIDSLTRISHAVKIGDNCMIAANSCIGGSTRIGNNCWIGLSATISNGLKIGNSSRINIGSVVTKDVEENKSVTGNFAIEHSKFINFLKKIR